MTKPWWLNTSHEREEIRVDAQVFTKAIDEKSTNLKEETGLKWKVVILFLDMLRSLSNIVEAVLSFQKQSWV